MSFMQHCNRNDNKALKKEGYLEIQGTFLLNYYLVYETSFKPTAEPSTIAIKRIRFQSFASL